MPDDEANKAFEKIDGNITGVEWEVEIQEPAAHTPQLNNNNYAALVGDEEDKENVTESTGVENDRKTTGVRHDDKTTGVDSDNESTESGSTGATDKEDGMALIEEAIAEAERDIAEGTDILAGTETETEDARNENMIHTDFQVPTVEHTYNFWRGRNPRPDYTNRYGFKATGIHCALTQKGEKLVTVELEQLHRRDAFRPVRTENLTEKQKHELPTLIMFLKENRYGSIKGCGVADGRKKREKTEPKDAASPTVSTEAVMLTAKINVLEGRAVAVVDIPGAYLSTDMDDEVHIVFRGTLAEMILAADTALYRPFVSYETGKAFLYVRLQKALYGCLKIALLFYEKLV